MGEAPPTAPVASPAYDFAARQTQLKAAQDDLERKTTSVFNVRKQNALAKAY